jgi:exocyst complex component 4
MHGQDFDSLQQVLKTSVPGLVALHEATPESSEESAKHRNLIPPNAFNVSTLFQPTLAFIERAEHIIPPGFQDEIGSFSTVLEDFVVKVFLPQLDERVTASFQQAVSGYDAYQIDRRLPVPLPPLKSSSRVMSLIHHLCVMLQTTPFHRENYSRLIVGVIVQYYQQCSGRFKGELRSDVANIELASLRDASLSSPATWAQREDVIQLLSEVQAVIVSPYYPELM